MITTDTSAPLVAIIGATGTQGSSIVQNLRESDKPYRIRAITRDTTKANAQKLKDLGCEVVAGDLTKPETIDAAFNGADIATGVTDFWQHVDGKREYADGKVMVDAATKGGVKLFVWSGLVNFSKLSNGKYTHVYHFDVKATITDYAIETLGKDKVVNVLPAGYMANFIGGGFAPRKQDDGTYVLAAPVPSTSTWPLIDTKADYGLFVRAAIEHRDEVGSEIFAAGEEPTFAEIAASIGEAVGKTVKFVEITEEQYRADMGPTPDNIKTELYQMFASIHEYGYFGKGDWKKTQSVLARPAHTFKDYAKTADWSAVFA